jgi:transposase, IS5 family
MDETTILNFRHLLERHALSEAIFAEVNAYLAENGMTLRSGTLVDATIIDAPYLTKNKAGKRDPEMSSTKKGNDCYFGPPLVVCEQTTAGQWKAHISVDADSGIVHSLETSTAKWHDSRIWDELLHGDEASVWADKAYTNADAQTPLLDRASSGA